METKRIINPRRLKIAREEKKLNQKDLAEKIGKAQSAISYIEMGRNNTSEQDIEKLSKILGVTVDYLTGVTIEGGPKLDHIRMTELESDKLKIDDRWVETYNRLKNLKIIEFDADFADENGLPRVNLSLVLSKKSPVPGSWIPLLESLGGNLDYIYSNRHPIIKFNKSRKVSNPEELAFNIRALQKNIEEDTKMLNHLLNQLLPTTQ